VVEYLKQAGGTSARIYANSEAIAHYSQAIDLAQHFEANAEDLTLLYTSLERALELDSQFDRVLTTYEAMERLAQQRGDGRMELASLMARAAIQSVPTAVHAPERARVLGQRALILADELGDQAAEAKILWSLSLATTLQTGCHRPSTAVNVPWRWPANLACANRQLKPSTIWGYDLPLQWARRAGQRGASGSQRSVACAGE
jgi:tetratricopeptide (TPR) repeat protein